MSDITDSMARYIDNIPNGAVHTCSDLCVKAPCLIVRGKQEIERLRSRLAEAEAEGQHYDCNVAISTKQRDTAEARLSQAEALLRGTEGYPMPWDWLERRDAFLAADSADAPRETWPIDRDECARLGAAHADQPPAAEEHERDEGWAWATKASKSCAVDGAAPDK